jgi:hypothetical protein
MYMSLQIDAMTLKCNLGKSNWKRRAVPCRERQAVPEDSLASVRVESIEVFLFD